jgi:hypothetical protein
MGNLIVRCSELKNLMTKPRSKSEEISATTKTWLKEKVKQEYFGYRKKLDTPAINKGIDCEQMSIDLLNDVVFGTYKKNTERRTNDWLTGEPDIVSISAIDDIKTSWSLETFPAFKEDAQEAIKKAGYDWQLRGYMMLFKKPEARIRYCMVDTPDYLLKDWDDENIHKVDHIDPEKRMVTVTIERDKDKEQEMEEAYEIANKYYQQYWKELTK